MLDYLEKEETKQHCARLSKLPEVRRNIKVNEPEVETVLDGEKIEMEQEGKQPEDSSNDDDHLEGDNVVQFAGVGSFAIKTIENPALVFILFFGNIYVQNLFLNNPLSSHCK